MLSEGAATAIFSNRPVNMAHFTQKMAAIRFVVYFGLNPHNSKLEARKNYLDSRKEPWEEPDSAGGDHLPLARSRCGDPSQLQGGFRLPSST